MNLWYDNNMLVKKHKISMNLPIDLLRSVDRFVDKYSIGGRRTRTEVFEAALKDWIKAQKGVK